MDCSWDRSGASRPYDQNPVVRTTWHWSSAAGGVWPGLGRSVGGISASWHPAGVVRWYCAQKRRQRCTAFNATEAAAGPSTRTAMSCHGLFWMMRSQCMLSGSLRAGLVYRWSLVSYRPIARSMPPTKDTARSTDTVFWWCDHRKMGVQPWPRDTTTLAPMAVSSCTHSATRIPSQSFPRSTMLFIQFMTYTFTLRLTASSRKDSSVLGLAVPRPRSITSGWIFHPTMMTSSLAASMASATAA
mmetsp:Transcript_32028/g.80365  ORF Transcript_32028/g.80365 Transcript_32028/m.80365 type:complete len:243 (-) Transcript_32028:229-957(-)